MREGGTGSEAIDALLAEATGRVFTAASIQVRQGGETVYERVAGLLDPDSGEEPATRATLFDLASLTKLFTTTLFLRLVTVGATSLDAPVKSLLPEFDGPRPVQPYEDPVNPGEWVTPSDPLAGMVVEAGAVTFRHLLSHTSGLPAWRPLFRMTDMERREAVLHSFFSYPTGSRVVYSDIGLILLGWAIEAVTGMTLADALSSYLRPFLGPSTPRFGPVPLSTAPATEICRWRGGRVRGEVHDENAASLGGVAGHAGLFADAEAVGRFGQAWLDAVCGREGALLPVGLAREAVSLQAESEEARRGIGWALHLPILESPFYPLSDQSFGHTGFTGTSLYVDPEHDLVVTCLTNHVYMGRNQMGAITPFRRALNEAALAWSQP